MTKKTKLYKAHKNRIKTFLKNQKIKVDHPKAKKAQYDNNKKT